MRRLVRLPPLSCSVVLSLTESDLRMPPAQLLRKLLPLSASAPNKLLSVLFRLRLSCALMDSAKRNKDGHTVQIGVVPAEAAPRDDGFRKGTKIKANFEARRRGCVTGPQVTYGLLQPEQPSKTLEGTVKAMVEDPGEK
eukprot:1161587-Pelagomonas_calceolata.AAC.2